MDKQRVATIRDYLTRVSEVSGPVPDKHKQAVVRALQKIYSGQTADEKAAGVTAYRNGTGFNGVDAEFGTRMVQSAERYGTLTDRMTVAAAKMLRKYAKQIASE